MASTRLPVVVPAIPPKGPPLSLLVSALRPDETSDPAISDSLDAITPAQLDALPADLRAELQSRKGAAWTRGITYAPENHSEAEIRDGCDNTSVDLPPLPAPAGLTAEAKTGGTISAELLEYKITAKNANGETTASSIAAITLLAEGSVLLKWDKVNETAQYKIYGRAGSQFKLLTTVGPFDIDQPAQFLDTGSHTEGSAHPPTENTTGGPGPYTNLPTVIAIPWLLQVEDHCSTWGFEERDFKGRAERLLENATPKGIEREFYTGRLAREKELPNNYLIKEGLAEDITPETVPSVEGGQLLLEDALANCGFGGQGMIHCQPRTTASLYRTRRVGPLLLDQFDNIIVPGVGYTGVGPATEGEEGAEPASGNAFIFATDLVSVRIEKDPTIFPNSFAEMTDWSQGGEPNTIRTRAMRFVVAYADFACAFCTEVKLPT